MAKNHDKFNDYLSRLQTIINQGIVEQDSDDETAPKERGDHRKSQSDISVGNNQSYGKKRQSNSDMRVLLNRSRKS